MTSHASTKDKRPAPRKKIGFLGATTGLAWSEFVAAFEQQLRKHRWFNGSNIAIEYRWAEGREDRYAKFANEFIRLKVNVIVTSGTLPVIAVTKATKKATSAIPIVFAAAGDTKEPSSLSNGQNVTGLLNGQTEFASERLREFREGVVPNLKKIAVMYNDRAPNAKSEMEAVLAMAGEENIHELAVGGAKGEDIVKGIMGLPQDVGGLYVCTDPLITTHGIRINTAAARKGLPTMYSFGHHVVAGGLMSYGPDFQAMFRSAADRVDEILRKGRHARLGLEQPDRGLLERVINLSTANALGVGVSAHSLRRGVRTKVIE
jgi:putative tryptophan/tyrosine transport system substrate-binding protein